MGYFAQGHCYAEKWDAANAQRWAMGHDTNMVLNGVPHLLQYTLTDGNTLGYSVLRTTDWVQVTESTLIYNPPECQILGVEDGLAMGWMVGGALIAAFCVMFIARALRGETGDGYGAG